MDRDTSLWSRQVAAQQDPPDAVPQALLPRDLHLTVTLTTAEGESMVILFTTIRHVLEPHQMVAHHDQRPQPATDLLGSGTISGSPVATSGLSWPGKAPPITFPAVRSKSIQTMIRCRSL